MAGEARLRAESLYVGFVEPPSCLARLPPARGRDVAVARRRDEDAARLQLKCDDACRGRHPMRSENSRCVTEVLRPLWVVYRKLLIRWWARGDSNAGPLPCQGSALTN